MKFCWPYRGLHRTRQTQSTIRFLVKLALVMYVVVPAIALLALRLDVQCAHRSRPSQTKVPALKERPMKTPIGSFTPAT